MIMPKVILDERDLEPLATKSYVKSAISKIELMPGPTGPQGEKGEKGERGEKGEPGVIPNLSDYLTREEADKLYLADTAVGYDRNLRTIIHRGYSTVAPENTIPAYILAKNKGFTYVGCDVRFTADDVAVLLNDTTIDRTSNGTGTITSLTYAEANSYDYGLWKSADYAGTHLTTFKEFMMLCKYLGLHPYIELKKDGGYSQPKITTIVNIVRDTGMTGLVTYISSSNTYLGYVKTADANARLGYITDIITSDIISTVSSLKTSTNEVFLDAEHSKLTDDAVALCATQKFPLEVWTVNESSWIENMNPYISGVTSDELNAGKILYNKYMVYIPRSYDPIPATGISMSQSTMTINDYATRTLTATVKPADSTDEVVWTSSNEKVATVKNGVITPLSKGRTTITAKVGKYYTTCSVTVSVIGLSVPDGYEQVRLLTLDEIEHQKGNSYLSTYRNSTPPYTFTDADRAGYYVADIPVEYGYTYRVDFISADKTANYGMQVWTTKAMEYYNDSSMSTSSLFNYVYDSGWKTNGAEVTIPKSHAGYPCSAMRITFRRDENNMTFVGDEIKQVLISRKAVGT